jgi:hypothetical protein
LLIIFLGLYFSDTKAQNDSTKKDFDLNTEVSLLSRNIWRGLDYGTSPAAQGTLALRHEHFEVGSFATVSLNGNKAGYGNWLELYVTGKFKDFQLTVDDYFFFNSIDSLNNYFDWDQNKTQHFIEGRLKYDSEKLDLTAGYCFYRNLADKSTGVYLEGEYSPNKNISFIVGGLTSSSWLSFYDGGGITTIGASGKRELNLTQSFSMIVKCSLLFNPNYRNALANTGVGNNPVYFVVGLTF